MQPIIYFASDHAGFELKNELIVFVREELGYEAIDCGADTYDEEDDFTDFVSKAAREVSAEPQGSRAIILGGSGQGEAMLANRFHDVRAVVYYGGSEDIIKLSRVHNDANTLSLGARFLTLDEAKKAVSLWLSTPHQKIEKYDRRIDEIETFSASQAEGAKTESLKPKLSLVPSLPAQLFEEIRQLAQDLEGASFGIQIDIVDGVFAPHISWPFTEEPVEMSLLQLKEITDVFETEVDCMCMHPETYLDQLADLGVKRVVIHLGSTEKYSDCIASAHGRGCKIGLAITNGVSLESIEQYVGAIDFIQVMGIKDIGIQGQEFDMRTVDTIAKLRKAYPSLEIAVDGAVSASTIRLLLQAGANRFAPGSAITRSEDPAASYKQLAGMIGL